MSPQKGEVKTSGAKRDETAAYAKPRGGYPLSKPTLSCFNRDHHHEKLQAGEADFRGVLEAQKKGAGRKDLKTIQELALQLQPFSESACQSLATELLAATPTLDWQHPLGSYHKDYSYEVASTARARELLSVECGAKGWRMEPGTAVGLESLKGVEPDHLRELVASLMTHHLRMAGQIDTVSRETPASVTVWA